SLCPMPCLLVSLYYVHLPPHQIFTLSLHDALPISLHLEVRVFHRDENTDLIDQYLTNGTARSIPIFVFLNDDFEQQTVWGPRARQVQNFVDDTRSKLPEKDDPTFKDKSAETHTIIANR